MKLFWYASIAAAGLLAASQASATVTIAENNGQLATMIHADDKVDGNVNTVYGTTGLAPSDVLFTANTEVRITGGGYALIDDVTGIQDFYQLVINPDVGFSDIDFSVQFEENAYLLVEYSLGGGVFTTLDTLYQKHDALTDYLMSGNGAVFDAIRLTSVTGDGVSTKSTISKEKQNSINVSVPNGVPEPSTWAMMLMGFGGMGTALRRRRRSTKGILQIA